MKTNGKDFALKKKKGAEEIIKPNSIYKTQN